MPARLNTNDNCLGFLSETTVAECEEQCVPLNVFPSAAAASNVGAVVLGTYPLGKVEWGFSGGLQVQSGRGDLVNRRFLISAYQV